jgi:putative hemolysin
MINVEEAITEKFPGFASKPAIVRKPTLSFLRKLVHEREINQFLEEHHSLRGFDFIDEVFDHFDFSYSLSASDRRNIPAIGRVMIFANHPIGSLDGLAILRLIGEIRPDIKIVANDMLAKVGPISDMIIPFDNLTGGSARRAYKQVISALENEEAVIIFPAGEVSRAHPKGVRDTRWQPGFLNFARRAKAPLLPIHIGAKNSLLFYGASMVYKPLGTALLPNEMFNKHSRVIKFSIGEAIPYQSLESSQLHDRTLVKRLKSHLYKISRKKRLHFETEKTIAHPEDRKHLQAELKQSELLGETRDGNRIYLVKHAPESRVIREIGRLREISFRKVGEGTGKSRDLDDYDLHYLHLVLWDAEKLEIAGAYRIGDGRQIAKQLGEHGFYTRSLYDFKPEFLDYLSQGIELGRSFVNPNYWGKASLDYLWQGLGAYLCRNPDLRYLIGPVSMSADYPQELMDMLSFFYGKYHPCHQLLAQAHHPYALSDFRKQSLNAFFEGMDREHAFDKMQSCFNDMGHKLPVLFKQYTALFEEGGFQSLVFSVDPDFGDCLDGLCMADLHKLKPAKRKRYIGS